MRTFFWKVLKGSAGTALEMATSALLCMHIRSDFKMRAAVAAKRLAFINSQLQVRIQSDQSLLLSAGAAA